MNKVKVPTTQCDDFVPRKGKFAVLGRCARCNFSEEAHKVAKLAKLRSNMYFLLRDAIVELPLVLKIRILSQVSLSLSEMHKKGRLFGSTLSSASVLINQKGVYVGLRRPLKWQPKMDPISTQHEIRCRDDIYRFSLLMESVIGAHVLSNNSEDASSEIVSLRLLKEQCCDEMQENRPIAQGVYEWLLSILEDNVKTLVEPTNPPYECTVKPFRGFLDIIKTKKKVTTIKEESSFLLSETSDLLLEEDLLEGDDLELDDYLSDDSYYPDDIVEILRLKKQEKLKQEQEESSSMEKKANLQRQRSDSSTINESDLESDFNVKNKLGFFLSSSFPVESKTTDDIDKPKHRRRASLELEHEVDATTQSLDLASSPTLERGSVASNLSLLGQEKVSRRPSGKRFVSSKTKSEFKSSWRAQNARKRSLDLPSPLSVAVKFDSQERLGIHEASAIVFRAEELFKQEANTLDIRLGELDDELVVFGDIHGQYFDLRYALTLANYDIGVGGKKLLFLGDYVDRGSWSCEVWLFVLALKVAYPKEIFLLRGNHECSAVVSFFGFKEECETKYGIPLFHRCVSCFQSMPLVALVALNDNVKYMCCHGGLSPKLVNLEDVLKIDRFQEPGMNGLFCDILWSDPLHSEKDNESDFGPNPARGCSVRFSQSAALGFLKQNELSGLIRGHEVVENGILFEFDNQVITLFSAPNYCGRYHNRAAFLVMKNGTDGNGENLKLFPVQFDAVETQPDPINFVSVSLQVTKSIAECCPYMPTTLGSFISRALQLWSSQFSMEKTATTYRSPTARASLLSNASLDEGEGEKETDGKMTTASPFVMARKKIAKALKKLTGERTIKFQNAKESDGINEAHPTLTQLKLQSAEFSRRMKSVSSVRKMLSFKSKTDTTSGNVVGELDATSNEHALKLETTEFFEVMSEEEENEKNEQIAPIASSQSGGGARGSMNSEDGSSFQSPRLGQSNDGHHRKSSLLSNNNYTTPKTPGGQQITFSAEELNNIQLLFNLIDRGDDGNIQREDIVAWSLDEGENVTNEDAGKVIEAVDADRDGMIGLDDFLWFAACCKEIWELDEISTALVGAGGVQEQVFDI